MSPIQAVLILLWWAAMAALVVWVFKRKARKKREAAEAYAQLKSFAESRGWRYEEVVPGLVDTYEGAWPLPISASGIPGDHVVSGSHRGFAFRAFEYRNYSSDIDDDGPDTTSVTVNSLWALNLGAEVPDLRVYRDGWLDTLSHGRAMETGIPQLDKDFHIVSKGDEERAWRVLQDGLAKFIMGDSRVPELGLRLYDGQLLAWRVGTALSASSFDEPLDYLLDAAGYLGITTPARSPQVP